MKTFIDGFVQRLRNEAEEAGRRGALTEALMLRRIARDLKRAAADPLPTPAGPLHVTKKTAPTPAGPLHVTEEIQ